MPLVVMSMTREPFVDATKVALGWKMTHLGWQTPQGLRPLDAQPSETDMVEWLMRNTDFEGIFNRSGECVVIATVNGKPVLSDGRSPRDFYLWEALDMTVKSANLML